jgi:hypothetical protein
MISVSALDYIGFNAGGGVVDEKGRSVALKISARHNGRGVIGRSAGKRNDRKGKCECKNKRQRNNGSKSSFHFSSP